MNTNELIKSIVSGDTNQSSAILNTLLKDKVKTEIDLQRVTAANKIFNDAEDVVEACGKEKKKSKEEVEEGNEFTKAAAKAVLDGEEEFEFNGKTYKATIDKEAAKKILGIKEYTLEEATVDLKSLHGKPYSVWHKFKLSDYDKKRDEVLAFFHKLTNTNKKEVFIDGDDIVIMRRGRPNMMPAFSKRSGITFKDVYDDIIELLDSVQHQGSSLKEATKTKEVTVDQFFSKYFGTKGWAKDADFKDQIDMMSLGGKEIADLIKNKNKKVKVTSSSSRGGWLTSFSMGGYTIEVESMDPVTEFA